MTDNVLLTCRNITQRFGGLVANSDVSIDIRRGEILGLIGPNGAGKSTLFNIIAGAFGPTFGTITLDGTDITRLPAPERCRLGIARTYQVPRSFDSMTVLENIVVGALIRTPQARIARSKAYEVLERVGLETRAHVSALDLTPPEKRRLEVARALATQPKLLLLDEVLTGLTPSEARAGVELIRSIRAEGITVVMVEHVMEIVMPLVDRAIVLNLGSVLTEGLPSEVVAHDGVIAAYLGDRHHAA